MELKNEIMNELESLSPYLAALPRQHPFIIPENYFEEAEQYVLFAAMQSGANDLPAPFPAHASPFEVPKGYFEEFPGSILFRIKEQETHDDTKKVVPLRRFSRAKVWLAAASIAALLVTAIVLRTQQQQQPVTATTQATVAVIISDNNMMLDVADIDEEVIVELLLEEGAGNVTPPGREAFYDPSLIDVSDIDDEFLDEI